MSQPLPFPDACSHALAAILIDPLEPGAEAEAHLRLCRACSEARVAYLAQEEAPEVLSPAGYHEHLPARILRKLPARPRLHQRLSPLAWATAAALLMAVGAGAFWAGRANRAPLVEASLPRTAPASQDLLMEAPFEDPEDALSQLTALSPEEAEAVIRRLAQREPRPPRAQ
jgi:hypothetical protein